MSDTTEPVVAPSGPIEQLFDWLSRLCLALAAAALLCIVAINGSNVVARYFFGSPFSWAEELMLFLMIFSVFSASVAVTWRNLHIRIDTLVDQLSPVLQRLTRVIAAVASIAILSTAMMASFRIVSLLKGFDQRSDALDAPMWIPQSFVTIGLALIALTIAARLVTSRFFK
jgi:C4-dicarboxylate transporter DctQ subunit